MSREWSVKVKNYNNIATPKISKATKQVPLYKVIS